MEVGPGLLDPDASLRKSFPKCQYKIQFSEIQAYRTLVGRNIEIMSETFAVANAPFTGRLPGAKPAGGTGESIAIGVNDMMGLAFKYFIDPQDHS